MATQVAVRAGCCGGCWACSCWWRGRMTEEEEEEEEKEEKKKKKKKEETGRRRCWRWRASCCG
jgi:hypothetical protein